MHINSLEATILNMFPDGYTDEGNDGQLIIHTGLKVLGNGEVVDHGAPDIETPITTGIDFTAPAADVSDALMDAWNDANPGLCEIPEMWEWHDEQMGRLR